MMKPAIRIHLLLLLQTIYKVVDLSVHQCRLIFTLESITASHTTQV